jgi:hypothetical protein
MPDRDENVWRAIANVWRNFANRSGSSKATLSQTQFGGTLGGPVISNRTFLFLQLPGPVYVAARASRLRCRARLPATATSRMQDSSGDREAARTQDSPGGGLRSEPDIILACWLANVQKQLRIDAG